MNPPPLPSTFGNYALSDFVEVIPPEPVSWLPQTPGWAVLGLFALILALRYGWQRLRRWHRNRYRREAVTRLQALPNQDDGALVARVNGLLKLAVLAHRPRQEAAALSGVPWVDYLNSRCPMAVFRDDNARLLASGSYRQQPVSSNEAEALLNASLAWLRQHRDEDDV